MGRGRECEGERGERVMEEEEREEREEEREAAVLADDEHCRLSIAAQLQQGSFKRLLPHTHTHPALQQLLPDSNQHGLCVPA